MILRQILFLVEAIDIDAVKWIDDGKLLRYLVQSFFPFERLKDTK